jgi:hypothetical protein
MDLPHAGNGMDLSHAGDDIETTSVGWWWRRAEPPLAWLVVAARGAVWSRGGVAAHQAGWSPRFRVILSSWAGNGRELSNQRQKWAWNPQFLSMGRQTDMGLESN